MQILLMLIDFSIAIVNLSLVPSRYFEINFSKNTQLDQINKIVNL